MIQFGKIYEEEKFNPTPVAKIKVLGLGGGGSNMVNSMIDEGYKDISFIVANTDAQALKISKAPKKIQLGLKATKGLGAGANPEVGKKAAEEDLDKIMDELEDADIVFLAAGLGGGTGSGALPIVAQALKERDILSVMVATKPFVFEGKRRARIAEDVLKSIENIVDVIIAIPNQKLIEFTDKNVSLINAFAMINKNLNQFVKSISEIITKPGHINLDFADLKTIMKSQGYALIGSSSASGEDRAIQATLDAISSPLLENVSVASARGIILNITGGPSLGLHEMSAAASIIYEEVDEDANIVFGSVIDEAMIDEISVTIIATGFSQKEAFEGNKQDNNQDNNLDKSTNNIIKEPAKQVKEVSDNNNINNISNKPDISIDMDVPAYMRKKMREQEL